MAETACTEGDRNHIRIVTEFLGKVGDFDFEGAGEYLADDAELILPFLSALPPARGREAILRQFRTVIPTLFERMDFSFDAWYPGREADLLIAEYHSRCPRLGGEGVYENDYITVFRFRGDSIVLYKEYLNPERL